jgi:hypothetical protein
VVVPGSAARTAIGGVVALETEMGEVRGSDLELGSVAVEADEESWGAAGGGDVAALDQVGGAAGGEGGG